MRKSIFFLLFSLAAVTAQARVGETLEECITRYGPVVERMPAKLKESDPEAYSFSKAGINVVAEFKGGKVWRHVYRSANLDDDTIKALLKAEAGDGGWSAPLKIGGQDFLSSSDGRRIVVITIGKKATDMDTLVVAEKAYAEANRSVYAAKLETLEAEVKRRSEAKPLKDL